jgi:hypothetical protein
MLGQRGQQVNEEEIVEFRIESDSIEEGFLLEVSV